MAEALQLHIVTPRQEVLSTEADWVTLPGSMGELGVLPEHVPLVTTLASGILTYGTAAGAQRLAVHYGYAQVQGNTVNVLSHMAEREQDVDSARARDAEGRAREMLREIAAQQDAEQARMDKYDAKLKRALIRQQLRG